VIYPGAMTRQPGARGYFSESIDRGHADRIAKTVLNLPSFAGMTEPETAYVIEHVKRFFKDQA